MWPHSQAVSRQPPRSAWQRQSACAWARGGAGQATGALGRSEWCMNIVCIAALRTGLIIIITPPPEPAASKSCGRTSRLAWSALELLRAPGPCRAVAEPQASVSTRVSPVELADWVSAGHITVAMAAPCDARVHAQGSSPLRGGTLCLSARGLSPDARIEVALRAALTWGVARRRASGGRRAWRRRKGGAQACARHAAQLETSPCAPLAAQPPAAAGFCLKSPSPRRCMIEVLHAAGIERWARAGLYALGAREQRVGA